MCNGSGRVVEYVERRPRRTPGTFDLEEISRRTVSMLNKNEYELYTRAVIRHLREGDALKTAATFNNLVYFTEGGEQPYIERLHKGLLSLAKEYIAGLLEQNTNPRRLQQDYDTTVGELKAQFDTLGRETFRT